MEEAGAIEQRAEDWRRSSSACPQCAEGLDHCAPHWGELRQIQADEGK